MNRVILALFFLAAFLQQGNADYLFPSSNPPGGKSPADVNQYMVISWEESGYSGKKYTMYEPSPGATYATSSWVGGEIMEGGWNGSKSNDLNLEEGDMGLSWASRTLAGRAVNSIADWNSEIDYAQGKQVTYNDSIWEASAWIAKGKVPTYDTVSFGRWNFISVVDHTPTIKNPDGSLIKFTFNVPTGLILDVSPTNWQARESKFGYWTNQGAIDYPDGYAASNYHTKLPISWGRETGVYTDNGFSDVFQENYIKSAIEEAIAEGHEISNYTLDGLSYNSPLCAPTGAGPFPGTLTFNGNGNFGFDRWGGEGFDDSKIDSMPWGDAIDEASLFGQKNGASDQYIGWKVCAGQYLSKTAWSGLLQLSEEQLDTLLNISISDNSLSGFMAPSAFDPLPLSFGATISSAFYSDNSRHLNSNLFYALKEKGYTYDNSIEEGWESKRDASNFLWPYTTDNGMPASTSNQLLSKRNTIDSLPSGVWEIPNNVLIVTENLRDAIYAKRKQIHDASRATNTLETLEEWKAAGAKIPATDIDTWILCGMSKAEWLSTMQYNLNQRIANNKAPMHYRAQTKVYTPMMDNVDLSTDLNKTSYGLVITNSWNKFNNRIDAMEEFVNWAITSGVYFVSANELIQKVKAMQSSDTVGTIVDSLIDTTSWLQYAIRPDTTQNFRDTTKGDTVAASFFVYDDCLEAGIYPILSVDFYKKMDHISFDYKTNVPLELTILLSNGDIWNVGLNNLFVDVQSGNIPISAFEPEGNVSNDTLDTRLIDQLYFKIINVSNKTIATDIKIKNLKVFSSDNELPNVSNFNAEQITSGGDSVRINMTWTAPVSSDIDSIIVLWKMHNNEWDYINQDGYLHLSKGAIQASFNVLNTDTTVYLNVYTWDKDNLDLQWSSPHYDTVKITNAAPTDIKYSASISLTEDHPLNTKAGVFTTVDPDSGDTVLLKYELVDTTGSFTLDSITGILTTSKILSSGDYGISVKVTDYFGNIFSKNFTISVTATGVDTYKFTKVDASDSSSDYHAENDVFGIKAAVKPDSSDVIFKFSKWVGDTAYLNSTLSESTTVTMPADSIIVIAEYVIYNHKPTSIEFNGTSIKGDADSGIFIGSLSTEDNDSNEIFNYSFIGDSGHFAISNDSIVLFKPFDSTFYNKSVGFKIQSTDSKGSSISDTFTVSILDPTLPTYMLVLNYGAESDTGYYNSGATVNVSAKRLTNKKFKEWIGSIENITDGSKSDSTIVITMPSTNITLTATYTQLYILLVENGSNSGLYEKDTEVTVIAENKIGESFTYWSGDVGNISDSLNDTITVTIPDSNITITANYLKHTQLTVENGSGSGFYKQDTSITIIANEASLGQVFEKWIGSTEYLSDSLNDTTIITIPDTSVYLKAVYKNTTVSTLLSKIVADSAIGADDFVYVSQQWDSSANGYDVYPINELAPYNGSRPNITVVGDSVFDYKDLSSFTSLCYHFAKDRKIKISNVRNSSNPISLKFNRVGEEIFISGVLSEDANVAGCLISVKGLQNVEISKLYGLSDNKDLLNFEYRDFSSLLRISSRLNNLDNLIYKGTELFNICIDDLPVPLNKIVIEYELVNSKSHIIGAGKIDITNNLKKVSDKLLKIYVVPNPSVVKISNDNIIVSNDIIDPKEGFNFFFHGLRDNEILDTKMTVTDHSGNIIIEKNIQLDSENNFIFWNGSLMNGRTVGIGAYIVNFECESDFREDAQQILIGIESNNN